MEKSRINNSFYYLLALGLSLNSVIIKLGVSISVTDITILLLLCYAIIFNQKVILNLMTLFVLLFALDIFMANMINYYTETDFSLSGFLGNYIRIVAIVLVIFFIPSLMKEVDLNKLCKAILFFIKVHCIIVIFDPVVVYPWSFTSDEFSFSFNPSADGLPDVRGSGLFGEPSFFAVYVGLMFSLVLQYQHNTREVVYGYWDILIVFLGLIASASLTGVSVGAIILLQMLFIQRREIFKINTGFKSLVALVVATPVLAVLLAGSVSYISDRLSAGLAGGSTLARVVGSSMYTADVLRERPLIGIGLGGENQEIFNEKVESAFILDAVTAANEDAILLTKPTTTYWAILVASGGIPLLLIFYILVLGSLLVNKKTFYVGTMIFFVGISKGGVFDVSVWWIIATVISYKYLKPDPPRIKKQFT